MTNIRRGTTEKAGDLIQEVLEHNNLLKPYRHYELKKKWSSLMGNRIGKYSYIKDIREGVNRGIQFCMDESVIHV